MAGLKTSRRVKGVAHFTFGGASSLSRPAVILASRRRYVLTRPSRVVSSLAPPNGAITGSGRAAEIFRPEGGKLAADLLDNVHFSKRPGGSGLGQMGFHQFSVQCDGLGGALQRLLVATHSTRQPGEA